MKNQAYFQKLSAVYISSKIFGFHIESFETKSENYSYFDGNNLKPQSNSKKCDNKISLINRIIFFHAKLRQLLLKNHTYQT